MEVKVGVSIILINNNYDVLIGKRKGSHGEGMYSLPGGHLEFGETFSECCDRELKEEIGLVPNNSYIPVGFSEDFFVKDGENVQYTTLYFAVVGFDSDKFEVKNMEPDKCEGWEWVSLEKLPRNMFCDSYYQIIKFMQNY